MIVTDVWTSLIVLCQSFVDEFKADGLSDNLEFIDWENHANINELSNVDLLGPNSTAITEDSPGMFVIQFGIGVSTFGEANVFRLRDMAARIFERLRVEKEINLINPEGHLISVMKVTDGVSLLPMGRAETRPYQLIQVECVVLP